MTHPPTPEDPASRPERSWDLLRRIASDAVDDDYARRASRPQGRPTRAPGLAVAVLIALGLLLGVAALQAESSEPAEERERAVLIAQIQERRESVSARTVEIEGLQGEVAGLQGDADDATLRGDSLLDTVERSRVLTGSGPVSGPGMRVVVDDAADPDVEGGRVLDRDLQVLVNGIWQAGAEAVSINGQRLGPLSAIRAVFPAITVNYRPLTPPYVVSAIGDPDVLEARFAETPAGLSWFQLETNYGIRFDIEGVDDLTLPGAPAGRLRLLHAEPEEETR